MKSHPKPRGILPTAVEPEIGGRRLPPGRLVEGEGDPPDARQPLLGVTEKPVRSAHVLWAHLAAEFPRTGLWPLILEPLSARPDDADRPWLAGELGRHHFEAIEDIDIEQKLDELWPVWSVDVARDLEPFALTWPGLAPAVRVAPNMGDVQLELAKQLEGHLGLVAVNRPADAPWAVGWSGPLNCFEDMAILSAVLRSWEDRFGATVVGMGFADLHLAVERPPQSEGAALLLAAEQFALCPDSVRQGAGSIVALAEAVRRPTWYLWWD